MTVSRDQLPAPSLPSTKPTTSTNQARNNPHPHIPYPDLRISVRALLRTVPASARLLASRPSTHTATLPIHHSLTAAPGSRRHYSCLPTPPAPTPANHNTPFSQQPSLTGSPGPSCAARRPTTALRRFISGLDTAGRNIRSAPLTAFMASRCSRCSQ